MHIVVLVLSEIQPFPNDKTAVFMCHKWGDRTTQPAKKLPSNVETSIVTRILDTNKCVIRDKIIQIFSRQKIPSLVF